MVSAFYEIGLRRLRKGCFVLIQGLLWYGVLASHMACQRRELPVPKYDRGLTQTVQIELSQNYKNQVWYSLSAQKVVSTNLKKDWDIAWEATAEGWHLVLNTSKAMQVASSAKASLAEIKDTLGFRKQASPDSPSGNLDSTAIGDWREHQGCYIISRGYDETARFQGFYKFKITSFTKDSLHFEYGDVYGKNVYKGAIGKTIGYGWVMYSLGTHKHLFIEPKNQEYDLCFTQFTTIFYNPLMYYQVTGVLNRPHIGVLKLQDRDFAEVQLSDTIGRKFSYRKDAIGYDWKSFDLNTNIYTVNDRIIYLLKDAKGFYYKLHFTDFYNEKGEKGYPTIEYVKL